jgi:hypothetical protein
MTIAAWATTTLGSTTIIGATFNASSAHRNQLFVGSTSGALNCQAVGGSATGAANSAGLLITNNTYFHACGVFPSATFREVFLNAQSVASNSTNIGSQNAPDTLFIGARNGPNFLYDGDIAEFGVWSAALTQPEIASLAKGMTCDKVRPQSLVFYAPLVRDLIDAKGGLTITNNNGATVVNHPRVYA